MKKSFSLPNILFIVLLFSQPWAPVSGVALTAKEEAKKIQDRLQPKSASGSSSASKSSALAGDPGSCASLQAKADKVSTPEEAKTLNSSIQSQIQKLKKEWQDLDQKYKEQDANYKRVAGHEEKALEQKKEYLKQKARAEGVRDERTKMKTPLDSALSSVNETLRLAAEAKKSIIENTQKTLERGEEVKEEISCLEKISTNSPCLSLTAKASEAASGKQSCFFGICGGAPSAGEAGMARGGAILQYDKYGKPILNPEEGKMEDRKYTGTAKYTGRVEKEKGPTFKEAKDQAKNFVNEMNALKDEYSGPLEKDKDLYAKVLASWNSRKTGQDWTANLSDAEKGRIQPLMDEWKRGKVKMEDLITPKLKTAENQLACMNSLAKAGQAASPAQAGEAAASAAKAPGSPAEEKAVFQLPKEWAPAETDKLASDMDKLEEEAAKNEKKAEKARSSQERQEKPKEAQRDEEYRKEVQRLKRIIKELGQSTSPEDKNKLKAAARKLAALERAKSQGDIQSAMDEILKSAPPEPITDESLKKRWLRKTADAANEIGVNQFLSAYSEPSVYLPFGFSIPKTLKGNKELIQGLGNLFLGRAADLLRGERETVETAAKGGAIGASLVAAAAAPALLTFKGLTALAGTYVQFQGIIGQIGTTIGESDWEHLSLNDVKNAGLTTFFAFPGAVTKVVGKALGIISNPAVGETAANFARAGVDLHFSWGALHGAYEESKDLYKHRDDPNVSNWQRGQKAGGIVLDFFMGTLGVAGAAGHARTTYNNASSSYNRAQALANLPKEAQILAERLASEAEKAEKFKGNIASLAEGLPKPESPTPAQIAQIAAKPRPPWEGDISNPLYQPPPETATERRARTLEANADRAFGASPQVPETMGAQLQRGEALEQFYKDHPDLAPKPPDNKPQELALAALPAESAARAGANNLQAAAQLELPLRFEGEGPNKRKADQLLAAQQAGLPLGSVTSQAGEPLTRAKAPEKTPEGPSRSDAFRGEMEAKQHKDLVKFFQERQDKRKELEAREVSLNEKEKSELEDLRALGDLEPLKKTHENGKYPSFPAETSTSKGSKASLGAQAAAQLDLDLLQAPPAGEPLAPPREAPPVEPPKPPVERAGAQPPSKQAAAPPPAQAPALARQVVQAQGGKPPAPQLPPAPETPATQALHKPEATAKAPKAKPSTEASRPQTQATGAPKDPVPAQGPPPIPEPPTRIDVPKGATRAERQQRVAEAINSDGKPSKAVRGDRMADAFKFDEKAPLDQREGVRQGRIQQVDASNIHKVIKPGEIYNYVILKDGTMEVASIHRFGRVDERGVKHAQIAHGRDVIFSGVLRRGPDGNIRMDFESGTYAGYGKVKDPGWQYTPDNVLLLRKYSQGILGQAVDVVNHKTKQSVTDLARKSPKWKAYDAQVKAAKAADRLGRQVEDQVGNSRAGGAGERPGEVPRSVVMENAGLEPPERRSRLDRIFRAAEKARGRKPPLTGIELDHQVANQVEAAMKAHGKKGEKIHCKVYKCSPAQLKQKLQVMIDAGIPRDVADHLIRRGYAGEAPEGKPSATEAARQEAMRNLLREAPENVTHALKNSLTATEGMVDLVLLKDSEGKLSPAQKSALEQASKDLNEMSKVVQRRLDAITKLSQNPKAKPDPQTAISKVTQLRDRLQSPMDEVKAVLDRIRQDTEGKLYPDQQRVLDRAIASAESAKRRLEGLSNLNKIADLNLTAQPVSSVLDKTVEPLKLLAEKEGIKLTISIEEKLPLALADQEKISEVLNNFINNSIKFTPRGGSIKVSAKKIKQFGEQDFIEISVEDTGYGISPEELPKLFQGFYIGEAGKARGGSTGQGLAYSRDVVRLHGGEAQVESPGKGKGAKFSFTLQPVPEAPRASPASARAAGAEGSFFRSLGDSMKERLAVFFPGYFANKGVRLQAYRGQTGPMMFLPKELKPEQLKDLQRLYEKAQEQVQGRGERSNEGANLVYYLTGLVKSRENSVNFNIHESQARGWAESSGIRLLDKNAGNSGTWAARAMDEFGDTKLILRAKLPGNQKYKPDTNLDDTYGIMTQVPHEDLAKLPLDQLVHQVRYRGKWYNGSDPRIKPVIEAQFKFMKAAQEILVNAGDTSFEKVAERLEDAYEQSGMGREGGAAEQVAAGGETSPGKKLLGLAAVASLLAGSAQSQLAQAADQLNPAGPAPESTDDDELKALIEKQNLSVEEHFKSSRELRRKGNALEADREMREGLVLALQGEYPALSKEWKDSSAVTPEEKLVAAHKFFKVHSQKNIADPDTLRALIPVVSKELSSGFSGSENLFPDKKWSKAQEELNRFLTERWAPKTEAERAKRERFYDFYTDKAEIMDAAGLARNDDSEFKSKAAIALKKAGISTELYCQTTEPSCTIHAMKNAFFPENDRISVSDFRNWADQAARDLGHDPLLNPAGTKMIRGLFPDEEDAVLRKVFQGGSFEAKPLGFMRDDIVRAIENSPTGRVYARISTLGDRAAPMSHSIAIAEPVEIDHQIYFTTFDSRADFPIFRTPQELAILLSGLPYTVYTVKSK